MSAKEIADSSKLSCLSCNWRRQILSCCTITEKVLLLTFKAITRFKNAVNVLSFKNVSQQGPSDQDQVV